MRTIRLVALAAALALASTACGGGTATSPTVPGDGPGAAESNAPSKPQTFADVPGEALTFKASSRVGVNKSRASVKVLKTEWTDSYISHRKPAPAGSKYLKVYFAVTAADPGLTVEDFGPRDLNARWATSQAPSVACPTGAYNPIFVTGYCHAETEMPHADLVPLSSDWEEHPFATLYKEANIGSDAVYVTLGLFKIPDAVKGELDVCASGMYKTGSEKETGWPCQKLQVPPRP